MMKKLIKGCIGGILLGLNLTMIPIHAETVNQVEMKAYIQEQFDNAIYDVIDEDALRPKTMFETLQVINFTAARAGISIVDWHEVAETLVHDVKYDSLNKVYGIDVSAWNGAKIDWAKVKESGIDFVILRCGGRETGEGKLFKDKYFAKNIVNAHDAGLKVGVYYFAQDITEEEAIAGAEWTLNLINDYKSYITYPVYYDFEGVDHFHWDDTKTKKIYDYYLHKGVDKAKAAGISSKDWFTKVTDKYCSLIEEAGYSSGIYGNYDEMQTYLNMGELEKDYDIWLARWGNSPSTSYAGYYKGEYSMWQYNGGSSDQNVACTVPGTTGSLAYIDVDVAYLQPKPPKTTIKKVSYTTTDITLTWENIPFADGYGIVLYDTEKKSIVSKKTTVTNYKFTGLDSGTRYLVRVRPYYVDDNKNYTYGSYTDYKNVYTKPLQVTELAAKTINADSVTLHWKAVNGATNYEVECYDSAGLLLGTEIATTNSYTYKNLDSSTFYKFAVRGYYMSEEGKKISGALSTKIDLKTKPAKVLGVIQTATAETSITFKWDKVTGAEGYEIVCLDEVGTKIGAYEVADLEYKYIGLEHSKGYTIKVRAFYTLDNKKVYGSYSTASVMRTRIVAVSDVAQTDAKATSITYSWKKSTIAQGYKAIIYDMNKKALQTQYLTENQVTFEGLAPAEKYLVRVTTCYGANTDIYYLGTYSPYYEVYAAPSKVEEVTYTMGVKDVTLSWKATEKNTVGYQIQKLDTATGKYVAVAYTDATSFKVENLESSKRHTFKVRAYVLVNEKTKKYGSASAAALADTKPEKVQNLSLKKNSAKYVELTWEKTPNVTGYEVRRYNDKDELLDKYLVQTNTIKYEGLESAKNYKFSVRAYYINPEEKTLWGTGSSKLSVKTLPDKVVDLVQTEATTTAVTLKWAAVSRIKGYEVICYDKNGKKISSQDTTATTIKYTGLKDSTGYSFKVRAFYEDKSTGKAVKVNGAASVALAVRTKLAKVEGVTQDATKTTSITVTWKKKSGAKEYVATLYDSKKKKLSSKTVTATSVTFNGLSAGKGYFVKINTRYGKDATVPYYNGASTSEYKLATLPDQVKNLKTTASASSVTLTWSKVSGAKGYQVVKWDSSKEKYVSVATLTSNSYKITDLAAASTYKYKVRAYTIKNEKTKVYGKYTEEATVYTKPDKVQNVAKKTFSETSVTVTWSKVKKAKGYEVICYDKNGKKIGSKTTTSTSLKYTGLAHNKKYSFKVRAYIVKSRKTIYGSASKALEVKTK